MIGAGLLRVFVFACAALTAGPCLAKGDGRALALDEQAALARSQASVGRMLGDHVFVDTGHRKVSLTAFRGKPLIVSLIYTGCTHTCPLIVQSLYRSVSAAQATLGVDGFTVVTIGFEADADTPERMRAYARSQGVDLPNWLFLSGSRTTIDKVAENVGFSFFPSPRGFDHLAQTTILDRTGRVAAQIYGSDFDPPAIVEPLKRLVIGESISLSSMAGIIERIRLFCTLYDPASDHYRFDYSLFIGLVIGALSLSIIGTILVRAFVRDLRARHNA